MLLIGILVISCKKEIQDVKPKPILVTSNLKKVIDFTGLDTTESISIEIDSENNLGSKCVRIGKLEQSINETFPFNRIRLCNVKLVNNKPIITYAEDASFRLNGQNGEVMVEIPKMYVLRMFFENKEYISISKNPKKGYLIDPAFVENNTILDHIYIGAYQGIVINNKLRSISDVKPSSHHSLSSYRQSAANNGKGFGLFDARSLFLIQRLYMMYYQDRNSQTSTGYGLTNFFWQTQKSTLAVKSEFNTNRIFVNLTSNSDRYYKKNQIVAVAPKGEYSLNQNRVITSIIPIQKERYEINFSGEPVNIEEGISKIYGQPQKTGLTNLIQGLNGNSNYFGGNKFEGTESVKFLNIENLWGNVWTMLDGMFVKNLQPFICENMDNYFNMANEVNVKKINYLLPLQNQNKQNKEEELYAYIAQMGYDKENPTYSLPLKIGKSASPSSGYCDPFYSKDGNQLYFAAIGGGFDHSIRAGIFTMRIWWTENQSNSNLHGARLIYKNY